MLDYLRNEDTVSRSVRAKLKLLVLDFDNNITSEELTQDQINKTLKQSVAVFQFLTPTGEDDKSDIQMDFADNSNHLCDIDTQETISKLFKLCPLSDKEIAIIKEHYFQNKNFSLIGKDLGITESRVSQIHKSALKKLEKYV
jgi:RNA polymerase sigma factor for flagellar operon FliA